MNISKHWEKNLLDQNKFSESLQNGCCMVTMGKEFHYCPKNHGNSHRSSLKWTLHHAGSQVLDTFSNVQSTCSSEENSLNWHSLICAYVRSSDNKYSANNVLEN
jgi:hypothetical protein